MNGSSEREVISRRYPNNETDLDAKSHRGEDAESVTGKCIVTHFSPRERKRLAKILQFSIPLSHILNTRYPLVNDCDLSLGEVSSTIFENSCNTCHSEALQCRKNPAYLLYNTSKLKGIAFIPNWRLERHAQKKRHFFWKWRWNSLNNSS